MKIIVTGGAGFIGSNLCERLLNEGHSVVCVDNLVTGDLKNIENLRSNSRFSFIEHDITNAFTADQKDSFLDADVIYNLACPASPVDYKEIPLQTLWVSAAGTKNMLELAAKKDMIFVHSSTSEVYGNPLEHPQKEEYYGNVNPIGERSCYDEGKRFAESMCMNYWKDFRFPLKIVRIFNTYGPRMRKNDGRAIPEFINRALSGEPLMINGDGSQTRSFCYIDDLIEGLIKIINTGKDFTGPVNIGNPQEISIRGLAEKIISLTSSESRIAFGNQSDDDPEKRCPDISLARKTFGFEPKVSLDEGLKTTINYFKNK